MPRRSSELPQDVRDLLLRNGDGAIKYDNRADASQTVRAEKEREFQLRRLGLDLLRYEWSGVP